MEIRFINQSFSAGVRTKIKLTGRYFRLLATVNPIVLEFGADGRPLAKLDSIEAGVAVRRAPEETEFNEIWITTSGTETVVAAVSDGEITYDPVQKPWYDRNGIGRGQEFDNGGQAPHATTTQWTYTVPAGKKFAAQACAVHCIRAIAAAAVDQAGIRIAYTPSGGSETKVIYAPNVTNTVGDGKAISIGGTLTLMPGDALACKSFDLSTGGTHWMFGGLQGIEFNA